MKDPASFWDEIKRRRLARVAGVYAIAAWAVIQVADTIGPRIGVPDWAVTVIIVAAAIGFPVALVLAWVYDFTHASGPHKPATVRAPASRAAGYVGLGMLLSLVVFGMYGVVHRERVSARIDEDALAVIPFRVASADPSLHYLREGMLDLMAAKLSGESLHALEPRVLLDAWRAAGAEKDSDLPRAKMIGLGESLNAGHLLFGDVVGTPDRITISVTLLSIPSGKEAQRFSVEGQPDSLSALVDQIARRLLTEVSSEGQARSTALMTTSLPALRAYLDGRARLRHQNAFQAARDFERALKEDSTFALAGLGLLLATSWYGDPALGERGIEVAWRERARLSEHDQALLVALVGPRYPAESSSLELMRAREQYLTFLPNSAEATYLLADHIYHFGAAHGITDWAQRALDGFRRAMELDSSYLPGYVHAFPLAASLGDTAFMNKAHRLRSAADTSSTWREVYTWHNALLRGDSASAERVFANVPASANFIYFGIIQHALLDGNGFDYARRSVEALMKRAPTDAIRRGNSRLAHDLSLAMGRPTDAIRYLEASADSANDMSIEIIKVRDATLGQIDRQSARSAAETLERRESRTANDSASFAEKRAVIRVLEPWRILHGDTSRTQATIDELRRIKQALPTPDSLTAQLEIELLEASLAHARRSPALRSSLDRVDATIQRLDYSAQHMGRFAQSVMMAARLWELAGDPKRAAKLVGRRVVWQNNGELFLGAQLREEGRLAALVGEKQRAIRAYEQYLRLRAYAEPSVRPQIDSVRQELARVRAQ